MSLIHKLTLAATGALLALSAQAGVKLGEPAPAFSLPGDDGKTHALADYQGKTVVLEWTNDGCPFVKKHYGSGNMQSLQKTYTGKGVVWLSMISSAPGKQGHVDAAGAAALSKARGAAPTEVLLDDQGTVGRLYEAKTTPHLYVIDSSGKLVYAGGIDSVASADADDIPTATPYVKNALDEVLAGKAVTVASTKPYGCSIKY
ncbi:MAG: thioredoxin family protein [Stagnimonas sp.]|nr:thioredoxin family protein [Stagnimonas sp.]